MSVTATRKLAEIAALSEDDPEGAILAAIGPENIAQFEVFHNLVLVGQYVRPSIKRVVRNDGTIAELQLGGDKTRSEDRFQGKVGLVLKVGPRAFVNDRINDFGGIEVKPGDWVMYRTSDAMEFFFTDKNNRTDGASAKLIHDVHIQARIQQPQSVY